MAGYVNFSNAYLGTYYVCNESSINHVNKHLIITFFFRVNKKGTNALENQLKYPSLRPRRNLHYATSDQSRCLFREISSSQDRNIKKRHV